MAIPPERTALCSPDYDKSRLLAVMADRAVCLNYNAELTRGHDLGYASTDKPHDLIVNFL